jgi:hypothetical protein
VVVGDGGSTAGGGWGAWAEGGTNSFGGLGAADCLDGALGSAPVGRSWQYLELLGDFLTLLDGAGLDDGTGLTDGAELT